MKQLVMIALLSVCLASCIHAQQGLVGTNNFATHGYGAPNLLTCSNDNNIGNLYTDMFALPQGHALYLCAKASDSSYLWSLLGTGTLTSVGLALPNIFSVSGSPLTSSGTITATLATQTANLVWAGPSSGGAAAPTFRALVSGDLPGGSSGSWKAPVTVATLPGTCNVGDMFYVTDTTLTSGGLPLYGCTATNTLNQFGFSAGPTGALSSSCATFPCLIDIVPAVVPLLHAPTTLTDGATVTWAAANVPNIIANLLFTVHSGSRTFQITNPVSGGYYTLNLKQDATGGEGLILGTTGCTWSVNIGTGTRSTTITLSSAANAFNILSFYYDAGQGVCFGNFN